jgi:hypothetical protein
MVMTRVGFALAAALACAVPAFAQETAKPVPKDSVRVYIPGCSKGYVFTAGPITTDQPGRSTTVPEGMHLRMSGPKALIADIRRHERTQVELTGLIRKSDLTPSGIGVGPFHIGAAQPQPGPGAIPGPVDNQVVIDVESWRPVPGDCPAH